MVIGLSIITPNGTTDLNDGTDYKVSAQDTRQSIERTYNQITATSVALAGEYLVHSVPEMVSETVQLWVYGTTQTQVFARYQALITAFENPTYQLAWTFADYSEHWNCNAAKQIVANISQTMLHNYLAQVSVSVPRFPTVVTP
jgi:hypothetical protein